MVVVVEVGWTVSTLQCEYLSSPAMGIETSRPRLTWINEPPQSAGKWILVTTPPAVVDDGSDKLRHKQPL